MKKASVIKIIPTKKKPGIRQNKKKFFNKLSKNEISLLFALFEEEEQLKLFTLNNKFKSAYFDINLINQKDPKNNFKFLASLNKLYKQSKEFCPYLNVLLNINIINLNPEYLGAKLDETDKNNRLKIFLEKFHTETNNNKILIQIYQNEDFQIYYSILNLIDSKLRENFKYDVEISRSIDINQNIDRIIKLFSLLSFQNIKPFNDKNKTKLVEIQNYFIENNIKTTHKYIWSQKKTSIENAKKYFNINKNCLLGINNTQSISLCESNKESINIINMPSFALSEFNFPEIKFKKIKFSFPSEEFNSILLNKLYFDNLEEISGLVITRNNINKYIEKINDLKNLKKITRIQFGGLEEEEKEDLPKKLFQDFFNGIKNRHSGNLVEITTWSYTFRKGKDYEFILNNFPKMRKIQEDYDSSGLYDQRIQIDKIFSCNAENAFKENDLCAITKMVKNYIKQKIVGENIIKFDLFNNFERLAQLIDFWNKNKEKEILDKINYINFEVGAELNGSESIQLNKINNIYFNNDNRCLIQLLKDVKIVNQVLLQEKSLLDKNIEFFTEKNICSIVWNKSELNSNEYENLMKIKSLNYLILDEKIINDNAGLFKNEHKFKIIPKIYYIDKALISK